MQRTRFWGLAIISVVISPQFLRASASDFGALALTIDVCSTTLSHWRRSVDVNSDVRIYTIAEHDQVTDSAIADRFPSRLSASAVTCTSSWLAYALGLLLRHVSSLQTILVRLLSTRIVNPWRAPWLMGLSHVGISGRLLVEKMKCSKKLKLYIGYIGLLLLLCPALGGALSDTAIRPSVCLSVCLSAGPTWANWARSA